MYQVMMTEEATGQRPVKGKTKEFQTACMS